MGEYFQVKIKRYKVEYAICPICGKENYYHFSHSGNSIKEELCPHFVQEIIHGSQVEFQFKKFKEVSDEG